MSYDVVFTETAGEISKEYKFKNYKDFLDWELQESEVSKDYTNSFIKTNKETLIRLTKENVQELVDEDDTVVIKNARADNRYDLELGKNYIIEYIDSNDRSLPIKILDMDWVDFDDTELEIYKVIKN